MWSRIGSALGWWSCPRWSLVPGRNLNRGRESLLRRTCKEVRGRHSPDSASDKSERKFCTRSAGVDERPLQGSSWHSRLPPFYWETPAVSAQTLQNTKPVIEIISIIGLYVSILTATKYHTHLISTHVRVLIITWQVSTDRVITRSRGRRPIVLTALRQAMKAPQSVSLGSNKHGESS